MVKVLPEILSTAILGLFPSVFRVLLGIPLNKINVDVSRFRPGRPVTVEKLSILVILKEAVTIETRISLAP